jgi:hypothetical protein
LGSRPGVSSANDKIELNATQHPRSRNPVAIRAPVDEFFDINMPPL